MARTDEIEVKLILKGGGCENTNAQYALPTDLDHLGRADRSLEGVRKCILHAVWKAQGKGCSPGAVGVCIGGDRTSGYLHAKEQLFRTLDDVNPDERLARVEAAVMEEANRLTVGPMGFGGRDIAHRLQDRRAQSPAGELLRLDRLRLLGLPSPRCPPRRDDRRNRELVVSRGRHSVGSDAAGRATADGFPRTGREIPLQAPITEEQIRALKVGDVVLISGRMVTGRDAVHAHLMKHEPPVDLHGAVLYHCGPVVMKDAREGEGWRVTAAGPTTSIREEPYQAEIIKRYGVRAVIGKGGMGAKTLAGLKESGAVYLNAVGGAAQFYARCIERVAGVSLLEFGTPEAMWHLDVRDFPAIVTMDSHGNSLHKEIEEQSGRARDASRVTKQNSCFVHRIASRTASPASPPRAPRLIWIGESRSQRAQGSTGWRRSSGACCADFGDSPEAT